MLWDHSCSQSGFVGKDADTTLKTVTKNTADIKSTIYRNTAIYVQKVFDI